jgi:hypothetical protein
LHVLSQCTCLFTCWVFIIGLNDEPSLYNQVWSLEELIHSWLNTWVIFHQMSSVYTFSRIRSQDYYMKKYDLQVELLSFQILENSTICIKTKCLQLLEFYYKMLFHLVNWMNVIRKQNGWERNANECKQVSTMGGSKLCVFGWRNKMYMFGVATHGREKKIYNVLCLGCSFWIMKLMGFVCCVFRCVHHVPEVEKDLNDFVEKIN